jgi:hypothetical protein
MIDTIRSHGIITLATLCFSHVSPAAPVTWTLKNVAFNDGTIAAGFF